MSVLIGCALAITLGIITLYWGFKAVMIGSGLLYGGLSKLGELFFKK